MRQVCYIQLTANEISRKFLKADNVISSNSNIVISLY